MKFYEKPMAEIEKIKLEDIMAESGEVAYVASLSGNEFDDSEKVVVFKW